MSRTCFNAFLNVSLCFLSRIHPPIHSSGLTTFLLVPTQAPVSQTAKQSTTKQTPTNSQWKSIPAGITALGIPPGNRIVTDFCGVISRPPQGHSSNIPVNPLMYGLLRRYHYGHQNVQVLDPPSSCALYKSKTPTRFEPHPNQKVLKNFDRFAPI